MAIFSRFCILSNLFIQWKKYNRPIGLRRSARTAVLLVLSTHGRVAAAANALHLRSHSVFDQRSNQQAGQNVGPCCFNVASRDCLRIAVSSAIRSRFTALLPSSGRTVLVQPDILDTVITPLNTARHSCPIHTARRDATKLSCRVVWRCELSRRQSATVCGNVEQSEQFVICAIIHSLATQYASGRLRRTRRGARAAKPICLRIF